MSMNQFREDELITRTMNGETRIFPVVGGRLRIAHEENGHLTIESEVVRFDAESAVVKSTATTEKGGFCGFGTASAHRDHRLADALLELAQTRSIARALRFAGYGVEYAGAEEVNHVQETEPKQGRPAPPARNNRPTNGNGASLTNAQRRALYALTSQAGYSPEDTEQLLSPLGVDRFEDLSKQAASDLISYLKTETAA